MNGWNCKVYKRAWTMPYSSSIPLSIRVFLEPSYKYPQVHDKTEYRCVPREQI